MSFAVVVVVVTSSRGPSCLGRMYGLNGPCSPASHACGTHAFGKLYVVYEVCGWWTDSILDCILQFAFCNLHSSVSYRRYQNFVSPSNHDLKSSSWRRIHDRRFGS